MIRDLLARLLKDETGGEMLAYAWATGLIALVLAPTLTIVGQKVFGLWKSIDAAL